MSEKVKSHGKELDQQKAENFPKISQEQLSVVLSRIAEGVTVQDREGRLIYANDLAVHWLGFENQEVLLRTPITTITAKYELFDEQGTPFPLERLPGRRALDGAGEVSETIHFRISATGEEHWLMVSASSVYTAYHQIEFVVNIIQDITDFKNGEQDLRFLAEVSDLLAGSMDYQNTLSTIAKLSVNKLADWCVIHLIEENGSIIELAVAHKDQAMVARLRELQEKYPPDPTSEKGVYQVLRTGEGQFFPDITEEELKGLAQNQTHFELLRSLGLRSAMVLPFTAHGHILGAITLVWSQSRHRYGDREIVLGKELARRAALAIDNVRLYQGTINLNTQLGAQVAARTAELERTINRLRFEITERQKVEKDLERNEALFSDLFALFPDAIILIGRDGKIVQVNAQAAAMFAYDPATLVGKSIDKLLPERSRARHARYRNKYLKNPQQRAMGSDLEISGRKKNGDEFPVDVMLSPLKIDDEWLVISVVRDITEQKQAQTELSEVQHKLMDIFEKERLILAQELHDGSIQDLFSVTFELAEIENDLSQNEEEKLIEKVRAANSMTQNVIQSLRNLSTELRPPALAPFGLEQAILGHMEHFQEIHPDTIVHLDLMPDGQILDERLRLGLFRIYQHAVSNIARHAQAENLWIRLDLNDQQITLEIKDDGIGFKLPHRWVELARKGHLGLVGTRERVEAIGGKLKIITSPGKGTRIQVIVPTTTLEQP